jgi:hypothetical protein
MKNPSKSHLPAKLARGRRRFESWRSRHKPPTRLPERLWALAAELACEYGLNKTARTLRLDYNCLKKRVALPVSGASPAAPAPPFLELFSSGPNSTVECTVECEDSKGARIRIHIKGLEPPDLTALSSGLWSPVR